MEDRWHGPEDPTNQEPETTRKKRRGTDFLSQYLLRRREQQGEQIEEEDNEESEEKPKKKFRNFFKGLFKNVVEPPVENTEKLPKKFSLENIFLTTSEEANTESTDTPPEDIPEITYTGEEIKDSVPQAAEANSLETENVIEQVESVSAEQAPETPELPNSQTTEQPTFERQYVAPPIVERPNPMDRTVFERQGTQPVQVEKEVVIERGVGMALPVVLVGAEYLARKKADKKLESRVNEKLANTTKEVDRNAVLQQELESLTRQNKEQIEALKRDRGIATPTPERRPARQPEHTARPTTPIERQPERQQTPPVTPERIIQSAPMPEKEKERETYKIMEQVAEAAEHDIPVERVFERSHEVKDDQTASVGAASIASIMASKDMSHPQSTNSTSSQPTDTNGLPVTYDKPAGAVYKQAMQRGFWTAIIIIILGTIAYLLK